MLFAEVDSFGKLSVAKVINSVSFVSVEERFWYSLVNSMVRGGRGVGVVVVKREPKGLRLLFVGFIETVVI